jgi:hypothetical protein
MLYRPNLTRKPRPKLCRKFASDVVLGSLAAIAYIVWVLILLT